jgi:DNA mismatch repair ATPase MutL
LHSGYQTIYLNNELRLLSLFKLEQAVNAQQLKKRWQAGIVSQPLLLPIAISLSKEQVSYIEQHIQLFEDSGMSLVIQNKESNLKLHPYNGRFILFPGWMRHGVEVNKSLERGCIGFNTKSILA